MKIIALTFTLALLATVFVAPAAVAQDDCPQGPGVHYISHSPQKCATIRFFCPEGQQPFSNQCGCGCIEISTASLIAPAEIPAHDELPALFEGEHLVWACEVPENEPAHEG